MKKFSLYLLVTYVCIAGLTACLEGGGNRETGYSVGILDIGDKSFNYVIKTLGGDLYAPELLSYMSAGKMNMGAGYYVSYEIDWDLPENTQNMIMANGYVTVTLLGFLEADSYNLNHSLTDTSVIRTDEVAVTEALVPAANSGINGFMTNYIFMTHLVQCPENLELTWDLSYDYEKGLTPTEEYGNRYYDLFLRAVKTNDSDKSNIDAAFFNSYYVGDYLKRVAGKEKELLGSGNYNQNSTFTLRIHYVSEIKDNDELVWENQEFPYLIYPFVSSPE
jgi:hypothetical protein